MLSDLDDLMSMKRVEALICLGDSTVGNPELAYLTRASIPRGGVYFRVLGGEPFIVVSQLDVGVARNGVVRDVRTFSDMGYDEIVARVGRRRALAEFLAKLLRAHSVRGAVALCGYRGSLESIQLADNLRQMGFHIQGEYRPTILDLARSTKDGWEIEMIRRVGAKTLQVVKMFERLLSEVRVGGGLVKYEGKALTVGFLKRRISVWCAEEGLTLPEGFILSAGPRSADPHYPGHDEDQVMEGHPIILDLFPRDVTGYMYDFTRTYVLGRTTRQTRQMLEDVHRSHAVAFDYLREGISCEEAFLNVCRFLGRRGYLTVLDLERGVREAAHRGFNHGLGHGVGLTIGEEPFLRSHERGRLRSGMVVTVEPGLYEPGLGGVRIEDVVVVGIRRPEILSEHPHLNWL